MDRQKKLYISKVIIWGAFIVLIMALAFNLWAGNFNGKTGAQGPPGDMMTGPKGDKGDPGHTPVLGVDYFVHNGINGVNGRDGIGRTGPAGKDAPVNNPPSIELVNLTGYYSTGPFCSYDVTFCITVFVSDLDFDALHTTISYIDEGLFIPIRDYIAQGELVAEVTLTFHGMVQPQTIEWIIEAWDGADLNNSVYSYTVELY